MGAGCRRAAGSASRSTAGAGSRDVAGSASESAAGSGRVAAGDGQSHAHPPLVSMQLLRERNFGALDGHGAIAERFYSPASGGQLMSGVQLQPPAFVRLHRAAAVWIFSYAAAADWGLADRAGTADSSGARCLRFRAAEFLASGLSVALLHMQLQLTAPGRRHWDRSDREIRCMAPPRSAGTGALAVTRPEAGESSSSSAR
jgi:hypothetical protein